MSNPIIRCVLTCAVLAAACTTGRIAETTEWPQNPRTGDDRTAQAQPTRQNTVEERRKVPWEFTLAASGTNDEDYDIGHGDLAASGGYYFNEVVELVVRQTVNYSDDEGSGTGDEDIWDFQTRVALDIHIPLGRFVPYVGGNIGYVYGDSIVSDDTLAAGPEAGVKIYLQPDAFLHVGAEYEFFFDTQESLRDAFETGQVFYTAGFGLRF